MARIYKLQLHRIPYDNLWLRAGALPNAVCLHSRPASITACPKRVPDRIKDRVYIPNEWAPQYEKEKIKNHIDQNASRFSSNQSNAGNRPSAWRIGSKNINTRKPRNIQWSPRCPNQIRITRIVNPTALGRHSLCLRKACAGALRPVITGLRHHLRVTAALRSMTQQRKRRRSVVWI